MVDAKEDAASSLQGENGNASDANGHAGAAPQLVRLSKPSSETPLAKRVLKTYNSDEGDLELVCTNVDAIQVCFSRCFFGLDLFPL